MISIHILYFNEIELRNEKKKEIYIYKIYMI